MSIKSYYFATISLVFIVAGFSTATHADNFEMLPLDTIATERSKEWRFNIGAAAFYVPRYEGADDSRGVALPYFNIRYKNDTFSASLFNGIDYRIFNGSNFYAGFGLGTDFGRRESRANALEGLGDIDPTIEPKTFIGLRQGRFASKLTIANDVLEEGHSGTTLELDLSYTYILRNRALLIPTMKLTFADEDYLNSYYGITDQQAVNSIIGFPEYSIESAGAASASLGLVYIKPFARSWKFMGIARLKSFLDDVQDSPLIIEKRQAVIGTTVTYTF